MWTRIRICKYNRKQQVLKFKYQPNPKILQYKSTLCNSAINAKKVTRLKQPKSPKTNENVAVMKLNTSVNMKKEIIDKAGTTGFALTFTNKKCSYYKDPITVDNHTTHPSTHKTYSKQEIC